MLEQARDAEVLAEQQVRLRTDRRTASMPVIVSRRKGSVASLSPASVLSQSLCRFRQRRQLRQLRVPSSGIWTHRRTCNRQAGTWQLCLLTCQLIGQLSLHICIASVAATARLHCKGAACCCSPTHGSQILCGSTSGGAAAEMTRLLQRLLWSLLSSCSLAARPWSRHPPAPQLSQQSTCTGPTGPGSLSRRLKCWRSS